MPIRVQGPDGATVEFPDDTAPEVMQTAMRAHYGYKGSGGQPDQMPTQTVHASDQQSAIQAGNRTLAIQDALGQSPVGIAAALGNYARNKIDASLPQDSMIRRGVDTVADNVIGAPVAAMHNAQNIPVGAGQLAAHSVGYGQAADNFAKNREDTYQSGIPTNVGTIAGATIGQAVPFIAGGGALKAAGLVPKVTSLAGNIGLGALTGGAVGALQPVTTGAQQGDLTRLITGDKTPSFAQQKAEQIGAGAITGGALPAIGALARKAIGSVSPEVHALAQKATNYGIDLTGPQISDSVAMKVANKTTGQVPFSGATAFAQKQQGQFNNAVAQTIGLPDGTTKIPPDVFRAAKQKASQGFNTLWQNNHLPIDQPLVHDMVSIGNEAHRIGSGDSSRIINNIIDDVVNKGQSGTLDGRAFQVIDSQLGKLATSQDSSTAHYASELQDVLRQKIQNNMSPGDAAKLMELRGQWRNILNLTPILTEGSGNVPPSRLLAAVANNKAGKTQLATGTRGDLGELAQIGKQFLRDPVPDSGTAMRNVAFDSLKGLGAITAGATTGVGVPAVAATLTAARLIQSGLRSRALYNAIANLPAAQQSPVRDAVQALLASQSAQNIGGLMGNNKPSANNISQKANP